MKDIEFIRVPTKVIKNKRTFGVGINDSWYKIYHICNGKRINCPYYSTWKGMLKRAYSPAYKEKHISYKEVTVCEEWLSFTTFREWMETQDWEGRQLDKDIITPNNKTYSPENCVFVSSRVNNLLTDRASERGDYKLGVSVTKNGKRFNARCSRNHLGTYDTEQLAYEAYVHYKHALILKVANEQEDIRVKNGLLLHANILLETLNEENESLSQK